MTKLFGATNAKERIMSGTTTVRKQQAIALNRARKEMMDRPIDVILGDPKIRTFTTGQVAKICDVAPRTVSKWFDGKLIEGYRIPGSQDRRVPREKLIAFLKKNNMLRADYGVDAPLDALLGLPTNVARHIKGIDHDCQTVTLVGFFRAHYDRPFARVFMHTSIGMDNVIDLCNELQNLNVKPLVVVIHGDDTEFSHDVAHSIRESEVSVESIEAIIKGDEA
jgi:hypothetical protein